MAFPQPSDIEEFKEPWLFIEDSLASPTAMDREDNLRKAKLRIDVFSNTSDMFLQRKHMLEVHDGFEKVRPTRFSFTRPWLPQKARQLLSKSKRGPLTQEELVTVMKLVREQATVHFRLDEGKYVAMTFYGRVVEVSETRVGLLKKLQDLKPKEQVFLCRVGFSAFSGRL
jgi:hypothetical protein